MPRVKQSLVVGAAIVAGLLVSALLYRVVGLDLASSLIVTGLIVLAATHLDTMLEAAAERARVRTALGQIANAHDQLRVDADVVRRRMTDLAHEVEDKISSRNDRLVTEVKVLEVLIRRMAESIADKAKQHAAEHPLETDPYAPPLKSKDLGSDAPDDAEMLEIVRRSLEDNRVDLYLQPIVSLPQRKIRYYEAFSRLRAEDGTLIMPGQYIRVAEPAGLMSVVDNVLLFRCVQVVRRLTRRHKDMAVFCNISRYTLQDAGFFSSFLEFMQMNKDLAGLIIFELSQDTLDVCGPIEEANLGYLADLGFAFSMDRVTSLDFDCASLRDRGVRFVKVSGKTLLGNVAEAGAAIAAGDLKDLLSRHGLNLIAEKIEQERDCVNLLDFNVDYGQGFLFGEPRPIRETALGAPVPPRKSAINAAEWTKAAAEGDLPPAPDALRPSEAPWPKLNIRQTSISALAARTSDGPPPVSAGQGR